MSSVKQEHYVPRCYLKNFENKNKRIYVFDKRLGVCRKQMIDNVASENHFYDVDINEFVNIDGLDPLVREELKIKLMKNLNARTWEEAVARFDTKYMEKRMSGMEYHFEKFLKKIIDDVRSGNVVSLSDEEKKKMSLYIAIQYQRTQTIRNDFEDMIRGTINAIAKKESQFEGQIMLENESYNILKKRIKCLHLMTMSDGTTIKKIADILYNHVWTFHINKTSFPFYTSDSPVVPIPHYFNPYVSCSGLESPGIEVVFPISSNLLLSMYDENDKQNKNRIDKSTDFITKEEDIKFYNNYQLYYSNRCVFSISDDFDAIKELFNKYPKLKEYQPHITVH